MTTIKSTIEKLKAQKKRHRKATGGAIRLLRKDAGYSLNDLSVRMTEIGQPISPSQLSRIENGDAPVDEDQIISLCSVFGISDDEFREKAKQEPWFVTRRAVIEQHFKEIEKGIRINDGSESAHQELIEDGLYTYVPHIQSMVGADDSSGEVFIDSPLMREFSVRITDDINLVQDKDGEWVFPEDALIGHPGEEIMYVKEGNLIFWFKQPHSSKVEKRNLSKGDCLHYCSEISHGFSAKPESGVAEALFVYSDIRLTPNPVSERERKVTRRRKGNNKTGF
ncbi:MAG TPA: XRE family transcriptional regulator [Pyrinomonadaceae bacterium]|jgi:transcriptional regulator with XRE-family HTH domain